MKTDPKLMKIAEDLVKYSQKKGAGEVQVTIGNSKKFNVDVRNQEIERLEEASSTGLSLKVIIDGKVATATSSDLSEDALHKIADNAIKRAQYTSKDPYAALPEFSPLDVNVGSLKLYDPAVNEITPEKKIATAMKLEKICLADPRVKNSSGSSFSTNDYSSYLANSKGFANSYAQTGCSASVFIQAGEDGNMFEDGWWDSAHHYADLGNTEHISAKAIQRVTQLLGAKKIKTQKAPIIFDPNMTSALMSYLTQCVSGHNIYMEQSFLAGKIGSAIAAANVNVIDDGLIPKGPGTRPFDSEGVPTGKMYVIRSGKLENYLLDTYSARKLDMKSNGHDGGPTNFFLENGSSTPEEIYRSVDRGLLLTKTIGQGTNSTTGDFSKGAFGVWIENGEPVHPVAEVTISGNLGDMLSNIVMIGNDNDFRRSVSGPTIRIDGMTISGI
ncbi:MAG: TldD/PmbA family protein [Candidatus Kapaibacterium sp.]